MPFLSTSVVFTSHVGISEGCFDVVDDALDGQFTELLPPDASIPTDLLGFEPVVIDEACQALVGAPAAEIDPFGYLGRRHGAPAFIEESKGLPKRSQSTEAGSLLRVLTP